MQRRFDSGPAAPVAVPISDGPEIAPIAVSFESDPPAATPSADASAAAVPRAGVRASALRRIAGWCVDSSLLAAVLAAHAFAAGRLTDSTRYWLDFLLSAPLLWGSLAACHAVAWSWLFVALCGRTPGMAVTGQRLQSLRGGSPRPLTAFVRAAFAVASACAGLFGFVLALFDRRGQTLHDKLCRCVAIVD